MDEGGAVRDDEGQADPGAVPGPPEPTRDSRATAGPGYVGAGSKEQIVKRLRRAEGQVRGIQRMVEDDVYCIDVLTQVSAATKALETVALQLLEDHLAHCVAEAAREGGAVADQKIAEASAAIARLVRS